MGFDFDTVYSRRHTNCAKYDENLARFGTDDIIPMWIADMDFKTAPEIVNAILKRAEHGMFGYTSRPDDFYEAFRNWQIKRNNYYPDCSLMEFAPGVVTAMRIVLQLLTKSDSKVLLLQPVYHQFENVVRNSGRTLLVSPLVRNDDGAYFIDFDDFESKLSEVDLFILCNPHNPVGKVWSRDELEKIGNLCLKHNVSVFSDEVHSDIILGDVKHTGFASISKEFEAITTTFFAPSKTFNIAGLKSAVIVFPNKNIKDLYYSELMNYGIARNCCFSVEATVAAYNDCGYWVDELVEYLRGNMDYIDMFIRENIPSLSFRKPDGTYLCWIDARKLNMSDDDLIEFFAKKAKLGLSKGSDFGMGGSGFFRLNAGCPLSIIKEALNNMKIAIDDYLK